MGVTPPFLFISVTSICFLLLIHISVIEERVAERSKRQNILDPTKKSCPFDYEYRGLLDVNQSTGDETSTTKIYFRAGEGISPTVEHQLKTKPKQYQKHFILNQNHGDKILHFKHSYFFIKNEVGVFCPTILLFWVP